MVLISKFNENVKEFLKVSDVIVDGVIFNIHALTAVMLFFASGLVSMEMYVGKPIQCLSDTFKDKDELKVIETFCWVNSTFTLTEAKDGSRGQVYHAYYQWVCFILFFQALIFYAPKWTWQQLENGLMKHLKQGDDSGILSEAQKKEKIGNVSKYFVQRLQGHWNYATTYWCLELICLVNVVTQAWMLNWFFSVGDVGSISFLESVLDVPDVMSLEFPIANRMERIFPFMTKCNFYKYGPGGGVQLHDILCVLGLNSYNRFIFLIMWYWFLLLITLLTLLLLYRVAVLSLPFLRYVLLKTASESNLVSQTTFLIRKLSISDWWVLYMLKSNVDSILFEGLVRDLFEKLQSLKETPLRKVK